MAGWGAARAVAAAAAGEQVAVTQGRDTMKIAIASGEGGTGKTTFAAVASRQERSGAHLDCDVEELDGHLFRKPRITECTPVTTPVPCVIGEAYQHCGASPCEE